MSIREKIEKVIRDESGSYQLMVGKMRAIDLDRCEEAFIDKIVSLISEAKENEWVSVDEVVDIDNDYYFGNAKGYTRPIPVYYSHIDGWWKDVDGIPCWPTHIMKLRPQPPKSEEEA